MVKRNYDAKDIRARDNETNPIGWKAALFQMAELAGQHSSVQERHLDAAGIERGTKADGSSQLELSEME